MWSFQEHRHYPAELADLVLWHGMIYGPSPSVILNKDGQYQATILYHGADLSMAQPEERSVYLARLHAVLQRLGTGWAVHADTWHEPATSYPHTEWTNPAAWLVDTIRAVRYAEGDQYEDSHYLTITWRPPSLRSRRWFEDYLLGTKRQQGQAQDDDARTLEQFVTAVTGWCDALSTVLPAVRWATPSETCFYLHRCVSWDRHPVGCPETPLYLDYQLTGAPFLPGHVPELGGIKIKPLGIRNWPQEISWRIPTLLQGLHIPYRYTVRWQALDKADAQQLLSWELGRWEATYNSIIKTFLKNTLRFPIAHTENAEAMAAGASIQDVKQSVDIDDIGLGWITPIVLVWGHSDEVLAERVRTIRQVLQHAGLIVEPEDARAPAAWLGTLPGDVYHNNRARPLPSLHLSYLMPQSTAWAGPERDAHLDGPPLLIASTAGAPFRLSLHEGEVGHGMILGPTRTGKSALVGLMAMQFLRYPEAQVILFDKDYALKCTTIMAQGAHYTLGGNASRGLHILGRIDEIEERRWAHQWLVDLLTMESLPPTPDEREEIWLALDALAQQPSHQRTLTMFQRLMQVQRLKVAFEPYLAHGRYPYFDAGADSFSLDNRVLCFEMSQILATPAAVAPAMEYIWHRLDERFTGPPTFVGMDEPWHYLNHPVITPRVADMLKAKAKKNVALWLSTQEIYDVLNTTVWQAIQASCASWIYLPNDKALNEDVYALYRKVGLTHSEIVMLAHATRKRDYLYKSAMGCRLFQLALSPAEQALVAASTLDDLRDMAQLEGTVEAAKLPAAWLRQHNLHEEADAYEEYLAVYRNRNDFDHCWRNGAHSVGQSIEGDDVV